MGLQAARSFHSFLVKPPYTGREDAENFKGNGRILEDNLPKTFRAEHEQDPLLRPHGISRAWTVFKIGHLTKEITGLHGRQSTGCGTKMLHDVDLTGDDHVQVLVIIPFMKNDLTGRHVTFGHRRCDGTQLVQGHAAKEWDTFYEEDDVR